MGKWFRFAAALAAATLLFCGGVSAKKIDGEFTWKSENSRYGRGFVQLDSGQRWYVEYKRAKPGSATIMVHNGMTYSTQDWLMFIYELEKINPDLGYVLFDMTGMGKTLYEAGIPQEDIAIADQTRNIVDLQKKLNIVGPVDHLGLSYGAATALDVAAQSPESVRNLIMVAPYLEQLTKHKDTVDQCYFWMRIARLNPYYDRYSDEELFERILRVILYGMYLQVETSVLTHPYHLEAAFRKAQGTISFRASERAAAVKDSVKIHMVQPLHDAFIEQFIYNNFWDNIPAKLKASRLILSDPNPWANNHKVNKEAPKLLAWHTNEVVTGNPELYKGQTTTMSIREIVSALPSGKCNRILANGE